MGRGWGRVGEGLAFYTSKPRLKNPDNVPWNDFSGFGPCGGVAHNAPHALKGVTLFFSYSHPPDSTPTTPDTPPRESISSRFSVVFESMLSRFRLENDQKSTCWERGRWWGMSPGGWAVAEKQCHYSMIFLPLVLTRRGAVPVKFSIGNNLPRKYQRILRNYHQYRC